jgi:hypothetical protein
MIRRFGSTWIDVVLKIDTPVSMTPLAVFQILAESNFTMWRWSTIAPDLLQQDQPGAGKA